MRYLVDECLGQTFVSRLRELGHDVSWVVEFGRGMPDEAVLARSFLEKRVLLTEDFDYGELVFAKGHAAYGVVILQLSSFSGSWDERALAAVARLDDIDDDLAGRLTVISQSRAKPRLLPAR